MGNVWVAENGEYEERFVWGVFSSPQEALRSLVLKYSDPYIVRWDPIEIEDVTHAKIVGVFSGVPGFSTAHKSEWDLTRYEVDEKD